MAKITLLSAVIATNSPPSGAAAGKPIHLNMDGQSVGEGMAFGDDAAVLLVRSTAGSGTMTVTIRMWGYASAVWFPLGTGADATKGTINDGVALGETSADLIRHMEIMQGLSGLERIYAEITAIGGTATAITVELLPLKGDQWT